jgi:hypothetical protein
MKVLKIRYNFLQNFFLDFLRNIQDSSIYLFSSLLGPFISYKENKVLRSEYGPWAQCYKTFYSGNLLPFHGHTIILCYKATLPC